MRSLYEPMSILMAVAAAFTFISSVSQGQQENQQAQAQAGYIEAEKVQEEKQAARDFVDVQKEEQRIQSRTRALIAAGGGDTTAGSGLAVLNANASEFAIKQSRLLDDSAARTTMLDARKANTIASGEYAERSSIFGGAARATSLLASRPRAAASSSSTASG